MPNSRISDLFQVQRLDQDVDAEALLLIARAKSHNETMSYQDFKKSITDYCVFITGDQLITGFKTFEDNALFKKDVSIQGDLSVRGDIFNLRFETGVDPAFLDSWKSVIYAADSEVSYDSKAWRTLSRTLPSDVPGVPGTKSQGKVTVIDHDHILNGDMVNLVASDGQLIGFVEGTNFTVGANKEATATNIANAIDAHPLFTATSDINSNEIIITQEIVGIAGNTTIFIDTANPLQINRENFSGGLGSPENPWIDVTKKDADDYLTQLDSNLNTQGDLTVESNSKLEGILEVDGDSDLYSKLTVHKDTLLKDNLTVNEDTFLSGQLSVNTTGQREQVTIHGTVGLTDGYAIRGTGVDLIYASGTSAFIGNSGAFEIDNDKSAYILHDSNVGRDLLVSGQAAFLQNLTVFKNLEVKEDTLLGDELEVVGTSVFKDDVVMEKDLIVNNDLTVQNNLTVRGDVFNIKFEEGVDPYSLSEQWSQTGGVNLDGSYSQGDQVEYNGQAWEADGLTASTDEPGISPLWRDVTKITKDGYKTELDSDLLVEGKLGVGTDTPSAKFHIKTDAADANLIVDNNGAENIEVQSINDANDSLSNLNLNSIVYIKKSNFVGIGTSSPGSWVDPFNSEVVEPILHIKGDVAGKKGVYIEDGDLKIENKYGSKTELTLKTNSSPYFSDSVATLLLESGTSNDTFKINQFQKEHATFGGTTIFDKNIDGGYVSEFWQLKSGADADPNASPKISQTDYDLLPVDDGGVAGTTDKTDYEKKNILTSVWRTLPDQDPGNGDDWQSEFLPSTSYSSISQIFGQFGQVAFLGNKGDNLTELSKLNSASDSFFTIHSSEDSFDKIFKVQDSIHPDATPFVITSGGKVGVGTEDPMYKLTISDNDGGHLRLENKSEIALVRLVDGGNLDIWSHGNSDTIFRSGTGAGSELVRIKHDGSVGIGTDTPDYPLDVQGILRITKTTVDGGDTALFFNPGGGADEPELNLYDKDGNHGVRISSVTDSFVNALGGKLSVGTITNPDSTLKVHADDDAAGANVFYVVNKAHDTSIITAKESGDVQIAGVHLNSHTHATEPYKVGINTNTPGYLLEIKGVTTGDMFSLTHPNHTRKLKQGINDTESFLDFSTGDNFEIKQAGVMALKIHNGGDIEFANDLQVNNNLTVQNDLTVRGDIFNIKFENSNFVTGLPAYDPNETYIDQTQVQYDNKAWIKLGNQGHPQHQAPGINPSQWQEVAVPQFDDYKTHLDSDLIVKGKSGLGEENPLAKLHITNDDPTLPTFIIESGSKHFEIDFDGDVNIYNKLKVGPRTNIGSSDSFQIYQDDPSAVAGDEEYFSIKHTTQTSSGPTGGMFLREDGRASIGTWTAQNMLNIDQQAGVTGIGVYSQAGERAMINLKESGSSSYLQIGSTATLPSSLHNLYGADVSYVRSVEQDLALFSSMNGTSVHVGAGDKKLLTFTGTTDSHPVTGAEAGNDILFSEHANVGINVPVVELSPTNNDKYKLHVLGDVKIDGRLFATDVFETYPVIPKVGDTHQGSAVVRPQHSYSEGDKGTIYFDDDYIFICTQDSDGTDPSRIAWKRFAISEW